MTRESFKKFGWSAGCKCIWQGVEYVIATVDFSSDLIGVVGAISNEPEEVTWVRCEDVKVLGPNGEVVE